MNRFRPALHSSLFVTCFVLASASLSMAQAPAPRTLVPSASRQSGAIVHQSYSPALVESGKSLFQQNCAFCHGRDAGGGETGPDLTRSKLVTDDVRGNKIGPVVRNGRPDKGMPQFQFSDRDVLSLAAFIHVQQNAAIAKKGGRRGVDVADLQTGNAEAGKIYFAGAGKCATCHSPTGDLAGIASRYQGLKLEEQMLFPSHAKSKVTVTLPSGQTIAGTLEYLDEFTVGLFDPDGMYHSWRTSDVKYEVSAPQNAHADLLGQYSDDDIHNLMAYLQTLR